jgi:hypothetical protein
MTSVVRVVLGAVLAATLALAASAGAAGSMAYEDERGEEPGAPDIQGVIVSNDDRGRITFRIDIPTHPTLTQDMRLRLWFSDGIPATGLTDSGADGFVLVDAFLLGLGNAMGYRCQDSVCVSPDSGPDASLDFSYASGMTITTSVGALGVRLDLGGRLDFYVEAGAGYAYDPATGTFDLTNVRRDAAPAFGGWWTYTVRVGPSALVARSLTTTPQVARAGERLTVRMHVVDADTGSTVRSGAVRCAARIGGSRLRARSSRFVGQRATCVYRVPARAAGQTLRGSVSVTLAGKTVTRTFARAIR